MPRYEFSEGTSNKFWDIQLTGSSFTTTWGKIGTAGQMATKSFASDSQARQEHDKLVAEKVKKGYLLAGGGATPAPAGATPRATPVVAAKPAPSPTPVVAAKPAAQPASAPTAAPATPVTTPTGAATAAATSVVAVVWTDTARRRLATEREQLTIAPRRAPEVKAAYKALLEQYAPDVAALVAAGVQGGDSESRALAQRVTKAFGPDQVPETIDAALAGAAMLLIGRVQHRDLGLLGRVVDFVVARGGLGLALAGFAATLGDRDVEVDRSDARRLLPVARRSLPQLFLQRTDVLLSGHWLALDDAGRAAARRAAEAVRAEGSLLARSAVASALLVPEWIDADLAAAVGGERAMFSPQALVAASDPAAVASYLAGLEADDARMFDGEDPYHARWSGLAATGVVASLLAQFDVRAAAPVAARGQTLVRDLDGAGYSLGQRARELRGTLEIVRCMPADPVAAQLAVDVLRATDDLKLARDDDPRPLARECALAAPAVSLPLVRAHAKASWAKDLAAQLERLVGGPAQVDYADPAALPTVLRTPAPAKTKLPEFWNVDLLPPLILTGGKAVPTGHLGALVVALRGDDAVGLRELRDAAERKALAAFGWELFQLWLQAGAPPKDKWAFTGLGALGNDETARRLTPLIRAWPGESQHARATVGLDVLGQLGSDVALMMLNGIAQKLKFKGLQERARDKMREIAEARGITAEQLADRLVPDLDLEDDGSKTLDFGPRSFRVGFDEALAPFVMDAAGTRLKDLPKPNSKDDAALATEATDTWKAMKKDARAVASIQLVRLELAMGNARRWSGDEFRAFFVEHPLLFHVVKRLVWAVYDRAGAPTATFRVAEDRSYADRADDACVVADDARVGIAHRLHLTDDDERAWTRVFADYELEAPFAQLGREVFRLTPAEAAVTALTRYEGTKVETKKLLGLLSRGWFKGPAQDAGCISNLYKPLEGGLSAAIGMSDGLNAGGMDYVDPVQTLDTVDFAASRREWTEVRADALALGALPAVVVSEVIRDLESLGATS